MEDGLAAELSALMSSRKDEATISLGIVAGLMLIALLAGSLAVFAMARSITAPINVLAAAMTRLAKGELELRADATDRGDEIGVMARAVHVFRESMVRTADSPRGRPRLSIIALRAPRGSANSPDRFQDDIAAVIDQVISASSQLEATAGLMSRTANRTSREASNVADATQTASGNMQTVAAATEELSSSVTEIGRQVTQSAQIAQKAAAEGQRTNETVRGFSNAAEKIGDVVKLISEIASQTNLLALNATIEAARAGDAGEDLRSLRPKVKSSGGADRESD